MTYEQKQTEDLAKSYIKFLNNQLEQIKKLQGGSGAFKRIQDAYNEAIILCIEKAKERINDVKNGAIWDELVIAFFGETNAGKSTIIETFRILFGEKERELALQANPEGVDGLIVGNGQSDYTQVYKEYKMNIQGVPFTLIDVPGIGGNEGIYENEIREALNKAHCVFYVQGQPKKPDAGTAKNIKKYLNEWVRVYSVYNVRGIGSYYNEEEERHNLLSESDKKVETQVVETFREILGNTYVGNISLQAHLALCSKAKFSHLKNDLKKEQDKLVSYFGNSDLIYEFSGFESIIEVVYGKAKNFVQEIVEANKEKHKTLLRAMHNEISRVSKQQFECINSLKETIDIFIKNIKYDFASSKNRISSIATKEYDKLYNELERAGVYAIEQGKDESYLKSASNTAVRIFKERLEEKMTKEINNLRDKINERKKGLEQKITDTGVDVDIALNFKSEIHDALKKLETNFGDIADYCLGVIGAVLGAIAVANLWNPAGWIVGFIGLLCVLFGGRDKKADAKKDLRKKLNEEKNKNKETFDREIKRGIKDEMDVYRDRITKTIKTNSKNIQKLSDNINTISEILRLEYSKLKITEYGKL